MYIVCRGSRMCASFQAAGGEVAAEVGGEQDTLLCVLLQPVCPK